MRTFLLLFISITVFSLFFLCSCRKKSDRVTVYTTLDEELARDVFKAFTEETGISVDWVRLSTGECVARMEVEKENPQASIWFGGVGSGHLEAKNKGLTMPYNSLSAEMGFRFRDPEYFWTGIYAGPLCFESNINKLKQYGLKAPTSWKDLCSPEYYNHIQMANPGSSGTSYNVLSTLIQIYGENDAFEYLKKLHNNITQYTRSGLAPGKNVSIGEVSVAIGYAHDGIRLKNEGYPLEITFPEEGTGYEVASISLIKNGPEEELESAKKLFDWSLEESAAKIYAARFVVPFANVPLPKGALPISQVNIIHQDDQWAAANKQRLVDKWNDVIGDRQD